MPVDAHFAEPLLELPSEPNEALLRNALMNLIGNAYKHGRRPDGGGRVVLRCAGRDRDVAIARTLRALREFRIAGVATTIPADIARLAKQYQRNAERIDVRDGAFQIECTRCGSCIDACDAVLTETAATLALKGKWAVIVQGSYARRELCPGSDLDIALVHAGGARGRTAEAAEPDLRANRRLDRETDGSLDNASYGSPNVCVVFPNTSVTSCVPPTGRSRPLRRWCRCSTRPRCPPASTRRRWPRRRSRRRRGGR